MKNKKIVITGGPGFGKTSIIRSLKKEFHSTPDYARMIIDKEGLIPSKEHLKFQSRWLEKMSDGYFNSNSDTTLFEYGFPDIIAYFRWRDGKDYKIQNKFLDAARKYRFDEVFIVSPIDEKHFQNDYARIFTFKKSLEVHKEICSVWLEYNYDPIYIPNISLENRLRFIRKDLRSEIIE